MELNFTNDQYLKRTFAAFLCLLILFVQIAPVHARSSLARYEQNTVLPATKPLVAHAPGSQAAEILGIVGEVAKLKEIKARGDSLDEYAVELEEVVLRRILEAELEVRLACSSIEADLAYTYDLIQRGQRAQDAVSNAFNLLNFLQFGILYALEGRSRINEKFIQSADFTAVSAGMGAALPTLEILFNRFYKVKDVAPPDFIDQIPLGGPVDGRHLPEAVARFLDSTDGTSSVSRRQSMYTLWKKRYGFDPNRTASLSSLLDGRPQSTLALNHRTLLLWSLHTFVEDFDVELLELLRSIRTKEDIGNVNGLDADTSMASGARDACNLLNCQTAAIELVALNRHPGSPHRQRQLEVFLLERSLEGALEVRVGADKIFEELNYAYDVALGGMLARRGAGLQKNFEANFIHNAVAGSVASYLYLKEYPIAGNEVFVISGAIGTTLCTLALLQAHGGWRKSDTPPNSLADLFELQTQSEYQFSPLLARYLNTPDPYNSNYKSRREELFQLWKANRASTINLNKHGNREKLAAMPCVKRETIKLLRNRISCLDGLKAMIERFDGELLELLLEVQPGGKTAPTVADKPVTGAPKDLLGVSNELELTHHGASNTRLDARLAVTRRVLTAFAEVRATCGRLDVEIIREKQALGRMTRDRDMAIALINNLNFFQINVLGMIIDGPLLLSTNERYILAGNRLTIVSGCLAWGLAAMTYTLRKGGIRLTKSQPNMLAACFGSASKSNNKYTPLLLKFLNTPAPGRATIRKDELMQYWTKTKSLDVKVSNLAVQQKLAANGDKHHFWNETLRLLGNRLSMMVDLRALLDQIDMGLLKTLREVG